MPFPSMFELDASLKVDRLTVRSADSALIAFDTVPVNVEFVTVIPPFSIKMSFCPLFLKFEFSILTLFAIEKCKAEPVLDKQF